MIGALQENLWLRRVVIGWALLFTINSLGTCIVAALYNIKWKSLDAQDQFIICTLIVVNWTGTIMAMVNKSVSKLREGRLPFEETEALKRNEVASRQADT